MDTNIVQLLSRREGWKQFVEEYSDLMFTIIKRVVHNEDEAADIYVSVLETLRKDNCKRLKSFRGKSKFSTWLTSVVKNLIADYFRRKGRGIEEILSIDDNEQPIPVVDKSLDPSLVLIREESKKRLSEIKSYLLEAVSELPERDQLILKFRFQDNLKTKEIANILNFRGESEVYQRLYKLFNDLKKKLSKHRITEEAFKDVIEETDFKNFL